jgi:hypothetical protein
VIKGKLEDLLRVPFRDNGSSPLDFPNKETFPTCISHSTKDQNRHPNLHLTRVQGNRQDGHSLSFFLSISPHKNVKDNFLSRGLINNLEKNMVE